MSLLPFMAVNYVAPKPIKARRGFAEDKQATVNK
jgi:hypothetical protein